MYVSGKPFGLGRRFTCISTNPVKGEYHVAICRSSERGAEQGSASLEAALLIPIVFLLVLLTVSWGRVEMARDLLITTVAGDAATAAQLGISPAPSYGSKVGIPSGASLAFCDGPVSISEAIDPTGPSSTTSGAIPSEKVATVSGRCRMAWAGIPAASFGLPSNISSNDSVPIDRFRSLP